MKITKREQVLLGVLLIMLLGYSYYNFIYTKQTQMITELKGSRDTNLQKWELVKTKLASNDKRNELYNTLNTKISSETDRLFPTIEQEEIIVVLDKMIKDSNLKADLLGFTEVSSENTLPETIKTDKNEENNKNSTNELDKLVTAFNENSKVDANSEKTSNNEVSANAKNSIIIGAYKMQVTFNFKGIYNELISFIQYVEDYDKKIIINSINLTGAKGSDVKGTIILEFYGIPKLNNDYFKWDYTEPSGNRNPFAGSSYSLQVSNEIITNNDVNNEVQNDNEIITNNAENEISDFVMTARPITSNLPTVTIEKAKDEFKQSYIYSDNEGIEQIEFYFIKIDNEYFYKYKAGTKTYPENFNSFIKFEPNEKDIILNIFSQKRVLDSDLSGANIKIINDTDKSVVVNVLGDDEIKPRIKILREKGDISIISNTLYYSEK